MSQTTICAQKHTIEDNICPSSDFRRPNPAAEIGKFSLLLISEETEFPYIRLLFCTKTELFFAAGPFLFHTKTGSAGLVPMQSLSQGL